MGRGLRPESSTEQGTMSAAVMREVGPPSVLKLETDFPQPLRSVAQLGRAVQLQCIFPRLHGTTYMSEALVPSTAQAIYKLEAHDHRDAAHHAIPMQCTLQLRHTHCDPTHDSTPTHLSALPLCHGLSACTVLMRAWYVSMLAYLSSCYKLSRAWHALQSSTTTHHRRPGEVLIKVAAASINPIDFKTRGAHGGVPKFAVTLPKVTGPSRAGLRHK